MTSGTGTGAIRRGRAGGRDVSGGVRGKDRAQREAAFAARDVYKDRCAVNDDREGLARGAPRKSLQREILLVLGGSVRRSPHFGARPGARSSMGTRRVPWRDWDEWEETRAGLCGSDPAARDAALARVEIWRFRGRVPHAVESTAALMEARLHDRHVPGAVGPFLSEHMLRMVYAMGIVRMVNGAVDPSQKGKFAAPVMTLARKIGIPTALVDICMEASHQELPSLSLLRHGTERALQWLFERYWAAQRFQLDELRRGARASVAALVDAESKRRRKARRAVEKAAANRGRDDAKRRKKRAAEKAGKAGKAKRRRGGDVTEDDSVNDESSSDDESVDDDDDSSSDDDGPGPSALRKAALNQLFAAVSRGRRRHLRRRASPRRLRRGHQNSPGERDE